MVEIARPHLAKLRDATNCSAHLGILDGTDILYVARYADRKALTSRVQVGARLPAHATSIGRAILSQFTADEIRRRFQGVAMATYSEITPTDVEALIALLARDAARGYVLSHSAFEPGIASVAAPIFNEDGTVAGAINITTPEQTTESATLETTIKDAVLDTARTISGWLGHPGQRRSA
jgi:DNA-binding IclR family transcriptional regulator